MPGQNLMVLFYNVKQLTSNLFNLQIFTIAQYLIYIFSIKSQIAFYLIQPEEDRSGGSGGSCGMFIKSPSIIAEFADVLSFP